MFRLGTIEDWCKEADVKLLRFDGNIHWRFSNASGSVEWWPTTGRVVDDYHYYATRQFAYSWDKLIEHLAAKFW